MKALFLAIVAVLAFQAFGDTGDEIQSDKPLATEILTSLAKNPVLLEAKKDVARILRRRLKSGLTCKAIEMNSMSFEESLLDSSGKFSVNFKATIPCRRSDQTPVYIEVSGLDFRSDRSVEIGNMQYVID